MKRQLRALALGAVVAALAAGTAAAQGVRDAEDIFTKASKGKPAYKGFIVEDSPRGLKVKGVGALIPADDIEDVEFRLQALTPWLGKFRQGRLAEKDAHAAKKEADRKKNLLAALAFYEEAASVEGVPIAKAHIDYKIALLKHNLAREAGDKKALAEAVGKLKEFVTKHPKTWHLMRAAKMLALAQLDLEQYADAEQTYQLLAKADVPEVVRADAEVQALLVTMRAGKYAEAETRLRGLIDKLPKGPEQIRAKVALAECLAAAKKVPEAKAVLKKVLDDTRDKQMRALAYNTMGYCYWANEQWQDARWEFLWVDTIYNQDRNQHAKALYYLADIFARLGEGERARECRELLLGEQFAGTEFHARARAEKAQ
jgi:TolA-binding protein